MELNGHRIAVTKAEALSLTGCSSLKQLAGQSQTTYSALFKQFERGFTYTQFAIVFGHGALIKFLQENYARDQEN